jgi:hypothetical protein
MSVIFGHVAECDSSCSPGRCLQAINKINPSVAQKDVKRHEEWLKVYGSI